MNPKTISIIIIAAACCLIIGIGWHWHNQSVESAIRESNDRQEGVIQELARQLVQKESEGLRLKAIADSAVWAASKVDTVFITQKYDKNFSNIRRLGTNALVSDLAKRLPK